MHTTENKFVTATLEYAEKYGFSVIPIRPDKTPHIRWEEFQKRKATADDVRGWWKRFPKAMVAVVTGSVSGIVAIDVDTEEGNDKIREYLPDGVDIPTVTTPGGGRHFYFKAPENCLPCNVGAIPGCDFRGEGGYIIAHPSVNGEGVAYSWVDGLSINEVVLPPLPERYIKYLKDFALYRSCGYETTDNHNDHTRPQFLHEGRRDNDLFYIANCLIKGGCEALIASQVIEFVALQCNPPFPPKEIQSKIESALKRAARRESSIAEDVRQWVLTTSGYFQTTDCHKELKLTTSDHMKAANMALLRLVDEGIIERYGSKRGSYRLVERNAERIDFINAPDHEFPIDLPLNLSRQVIIYPGNVIVIAGSKSSGKTAFALDTIKRNMNRYPIVYLNSEMHGTEMKKRLLLHNDLALSDWDKGMEALSVSHDWQDFVTKDQKLFVIDYIETADQDAWKVGAIIKAIHDKLGEGVAVICLQKKADQDLARGGQYTLDKARLYISLDRGKAKIIDAKAFRKENPVGKTLEFKLVKGAEFIAQGDWHG